MYNCIFILGPTASGKTNLSIELAKKLKTEIINADSMQIYDKLDIGTAKPTSSELKQVKHHLIGFVNPKNQFSVNEYKEHALPIILKLINENKIPIIVGGTGFYVESLLNNYNYGNTLKNDNIRNKYLNLANEFGNEYVYNILKVVDEKSAKKIHPNDLKRVIRAIEIFEITGTKKSELNNTMQTNNNGLNPLIIILNWNRDELYQRINMRVLNMIENGLVNEVKELKETGINLNNQCMQGIGYKEIYLYLKNDISLKEAIEKIQQASRNYAKRQITWFKRIENAVWFNCSETNNNKIINFCLKKIKGN